MFAVGLKVNAQVKEDFNPEEATIVGASAQIEKENFDQIKTDISNKNETDFSSQNTINVPDEIKKENKIIKEKPARFPTSSSDWVNVGNPGFSAGEAEGTSIVFDSNDVPYVLYQDVANGYKATVMKFNGTNWVNVGVSGFSAGSVGWPSLAIDSNNVLYVAYQDGGNSDKATVMKFDGTNWVSVGIPGFSTGGVFDISLAIDSNNIPYIAYPNYINGNEGELIVMKFNGTNWVSVGNPGVNAVAPSMVIGSNNVIYISDLFDCFTTTCSTNILKYDGANWTNIGNLGATSYSSSLAIDSNNIPYVAYTYGQNNDNVAVSKFDGTNWVLVGDPGISSEMAYGYSLKIDSNDVPYVAYTNYICFSGGCGKASVSKFNGTSWVNVGIPGFSADGAQWVSLSFDSNNIPYVAYQDYGNNQKATVMKYIQPNTSFTITSPNGGETLNATDPFTVTWNSGFTSNDPVYFELIHKGVGVISSPTSSPDWGTDEGTDTFYVLTNSTINDGTETFTLPSNIEPGEYTLHGGFVGMDVSDYSDNLFTIN